MTRVLAAALAAVIVMPATARADEEEAAGSAAETDDAGEKSGKRADQGDQAGELSEEAVGDPSGRLTLPSGQILLAAAVEANLGKSAAFKPFSIAPDLWYGATDQLTLGLVHSGRGASGFLTGVGNGLCFNGGGAMGSCAAGLGKVYRSVGAEARYQISEGGFALAFAGGLYASAFDPKLVLSLKAGVVGRWRSDSVAIELSPALFAGLTQRKLDVGGMEVPFNEERFGLPVTAFFRLSPAFALAAQLGVNLVVEHAGDTWQIPAALGVAWLASPKLSVDLAFGLTAIADASEATKPFDGRNLMLGVGYGL